MWTLYYKELMYIYTEPLSVWAHTTQLPRRLPWQHTSASDFNKVDNIPEGVVCVQYLS